jgi:hypothetical protein
MFLPYSLENQSFVLNEFCIASTYKKALLLFLACHLQLSNLISIPVVKLVIPPIPGLLFVLSHK